MMAQPWKCIQREQTGHRELTFNVKHVVLHPGPPLFVAPEHPRLMNPITWGTFKKIRTPALHWTVEPGSKAVGGEVGMIAENIFSKALQGFCLAKCGNHGN